MLREEGEGRLFTTEEIVLLEEINSLLVVLIACHDEHGALLRLLRDDW